jgi:hypothetical protein
LGSGDPLPDDKVDGEDADRGDDGGDDGVDEEA